MIYGLLPNHLHFSRGIILFGTLVVSAVLLIWRTILHFIQYKTLDTNQQNFTKSILVGNLTQWDKVTNMLQTYNKNYQQIGYVDDTTDTNSPWLGDVSKLSEIVKIYGINEIIFSNDSISTEHTIQLMNEIGPHVNYYTIPAHSNFVIGSHSKNANGLYFGEQIELNLSQQEYRNQKRVFDIAIALCSIMLAPLLYITPTTRRWVRHSIAVLRGHETWVGYSSDHTSALPLLKPGVYTTSYFLQEKNTPYDKNLDLLYAKNYSIAMDIKAIFS